MSDNIGKHLFRPRWGAGYVGIIIGETEKMWQVREVTYRGTTRESRTLKDKYDLLADPSIDPKAAEAAYKAAWDFHVPEVKAAKDAYSAAADKQSAAAKAALLRGAT